MKADYDAMLSAYETLNKLVDTMVDEMKNAKNIVNKLNNKEIWDGKGFDAYNSKFKNAATNFSANLNELYELNSAIKRAVENYKQTDQKVISEVS